MSEERLTRRDFLKVSAAAGVGIVISIYLPGCLQADRTPAATTEPAAALAPNLFVTISTDGQVTITCPRPDMGQGTRTALPMILAEELGADWASVQVKQADADPAYGDQQTGGSTSIQVYYDPLRRAGAVGRALLIAAAAQLWSAPPESCTARNGLVTNRETGEQFSFGELVETAMTLPVPNPVAAGLSDPSEFTLIGTTVPRFDAPDIVTGRAVFGMDVRAQGVLYAAVARCPSFGGRLAGYDDAAALAVPGVVRVVEIQCGMDGTTPTRGVAVVARDTWSAIQGRSALRVDWEEGDGASLDSAQIEGQLRERAAIEATEGRLVAYYRVPYYSHAPMEPINSIAWVHEDRCEIWAPTQNPQLLRDRIAQTYHFSEVVLHVPLVGGGFGRRLEFANTPGGNLPAMHLTEAVNISREVGAPVHVVWTRDDDIHFDYFQPLSVTRMTATLGNINSIQERRLDAAGYAVPTGALRAVTNIPQAFAHESFMDEYAAATGQDPVEVRRQVLQPRARTVLDLAAEQAGWGSPLPPGRGRGAAIHSTWGVSPCAEVAEVSVDADGRVRVERVVAAIDCGVAINPDLVRAQVEGGIIFGLSTTLKGEITIVGGRVQQSNFHDYPLLGMSESPEIEVHIVESTEDPTGIGEMANPPISAAVANAIFAATGKRVRRLPIRPEDILSAA
jgi:isoquinoline 1-oxidoreductase beta subunit